MSQARWWEIASHSTSHPCSSHRRNRITILIPAGSTLRAHTRLTIHRHWRCISGTERPSWSTASTCRSDAGIAVAHIGGRRVERSPVVHASPPAILTVSLMALHLESSKLRGALRLHGGGAAHWRRTFSFGQLVRHHAVLGQVLVVIRAIHVRIFRDPLLAGLPAHQRSSHGACDYAGSHNEDGSR